jgi:hypothetical protein
MVSASVYVPKAPTNGVKSFLRPRRGIMAGPTRQPERNRVIVLIWVKAGLRAGEIANLTWLPTQLIRFC